MWQWDDDLKVFCDVLGIEKPIVYGAFFGGMVAFAYATRHPGHDTETGNDVARMSGHRDGIFGPSFSTEGTQIVDTGSSCGVVWRGGAERSSAFAALLTVSVARMVKTSALLEVRIL
jgi:pimeloyl-ACP methyl ester carboxylesterase